MYILAPELSRFVSDKDRRKIQAMIYEEHSDVYEVSKNNFQLLLGARFAYCANFYVIGSPFLSAMNKAL
jgi:hypothetical protein